MLLPVGISNFRELIEHRSDNGESYLFVDKSMLIKEVINDGSKVAVITRPRRFGKTINMSMLQHFLAAEVDGKPTKHLFSWLQIEEHTDTVERHQGKYPVIFVSFKDIKSSNFDECLEMLSGTIADLYKSYRNELYSDKINVDERAYINKIIKSEASKVQLSRSLKKLSEYLSIYYGTKPVLLIDEYDAPIIEAYTHGYYDQAIQFFRNLLSSVLKDNPYLEKGVLTGILRISKESIFSSLNNVKVYSILHNKYSNYFGFTEIELDTLMNKTKIDMPREQIKNWYNGYTFGNNLVYNPWSIINCLAEDGEITPYWINTSGNNLIRKQLLNASSEVQDKLQNLMQGRSITQVIDEHTVFEYLDTNQTALWSLMLFSGYLKAENITSKGLRVLAELSIPNQEVLAFYEYIITEWLGAKRGTEWYDNFINNLVNGKIEEFAEDLQFLIDSTFSFRDTDKKNGERFYHGVMLGLVASLRDSYEIKSNRESGKGLFDAMLIPNNKSDNGIIFEFKVADREDQLESAANLALQQIKDKNYAQELEQQGINNIIKIGIAFAAKQIKVVSD